MQISHYVSERRRKKNRRRKYLLGGAVFLGVYVLLLGALAFVVRMPAFQISEIAIKGNNAVSRDEIIGLLQASVVRDDALVTKPLGGLKALFGFKNMLIWPGTLPSSTIAIVPQLAGMTIDKNYFLHTITVTVTERQPFAVWCTMLVDDCFWFDIHGIIFGRTPDTEGGAISVVRDFSGRKFSVGDSVIQTELIPNLISIIEDIKQSGVSISSINIQDLSLEEVDVATVNGPNLKFSLRFSPDNDVSVLRGLMRDPGFSKLQYVDFTVANRVYYQ